MYRRSAGTQFEDYGLEVALQAELVLYAGTITDKVQTKGSGDLNPQVWSILIRWTEPSQPVSYRTGKDFSRQKQSVSFCRYQAAN